MDASTGATPEGAQRYRDRFPDRPDYFRLQQGLWMSSVGLGTYLGEPDAATDARYVAAVQRAVECGINVIDTAINYRFQRSERSVGAALKALFESGRAQRDEVVVATKGGYVPFDGEWPASPERYIRDHYIDAGIARADDFVGTHCMTPEYLWHQLDRSLRNLGLDCIDVYYLHNPETQLEAIPRDRFRQRLRAAIAFLETCVDEGRIQFYGLATWNGLRASPKSTDYLSLDDTLALAREARGIHHHCRFVQLPFNVAMLDALTARNQRAAGESMSLLEAAQRLGVTVMCSATVLQARLIGRLSAALREKFGALTTDAQRAIQFTRSAPGVATALVGMSRVEHVDENLAVSRTPPLDEVSFKRLLVRPTGPLDPSSLQ